MVFFCVCVYVSGRWCAQHPVQNETVFRSHGIYTDFWQEEPEEDALVTLVWDSDTKEISQQFWIILSMGIKPPSWVKQNRMVRLIAEQKILD